MVVDGRRYGLSLGAPMRILHVTRENEADRLYGLGRSLQPVIEALTRRNHSVRYLYQNDLGLAARNWQLRLHRWLSPLVRWIWADAGVMLLHVWLERLNMGRLAARVAARDQYDCVHLHDPWLACGYWLAGWWYRPRRCAWGVTQHGFGSYTQATKEEGLDYTDWLLRWHQKLERRILSRADWVVCPTVSARAQLQRDLQLAACPGHWHVISHAAPAMYPPDRASARAVLGWQDGVFHLLAIGRLAPVKRFSLLLAACIEAKRPINITILGAGDVAALQQLLRETHTPQITLTVLTTSDVPTYLAAADLYVSSSVNESFGMANVEALACGCPAICTAVGGVPEAVGGGAWLLPGTLAAMALGIQSMYDDVILRNKWSAIGKQQVSLLPSSTKVAELYEDIYCSASQASGSTK